MSARDPQPELDRYLLLTDRTTFRLVLVLFVVGVVLAAATGTPGTPGWHLKQFVMSALGG